MRKLIIILLVAFLGFAANVNGQVQNKLFTNDTISADTNTYTSNRLVDKYSSTVVIFAFTKSDVTDSLSVAKLQGSLDNTNWVDLSDASANLTNTTTDGTSALYVTSPVFLYYRGFLACASGDAVAITNARIVIKED